jgi:hypothetical protein
VECSVLTLCRRMWESLISMKRLEAGSAALEVHTSRRYKFCFFTRHDMCHMYLIRITYVSCRRRVYLLRFLHRGTELGGGDGRHDSFTPRMSSQISLMLMHLVLLATFVVQISAHLSVLVPLICVLYHDFYRIISCSVAVISSYYEM